MAPRFPGSGDWSRNQKAAETIVQARSGERKKELAPWEKNVIKILLALSVVKIIGFAIWYFRLI